MATHRLLPSTVYVKLLDVELSQEIFSSAYHTYLKVLRFTAWPLSVYFIDITFFWLHEALFTTLQHSHSQHCHKCFVLSWLSPEVCVVDPGDRIGNRAPRCKEKQRQIVPHRGTISLRFIQSFSVMSPMCTGCWAQNPVRCEEVVSLSYVIFSPRISIPTP